MSVPPAESSSSYAAEPGVTASEDKCRLQISGLPQRLSMPAPRWNGCSLTGYFRQENSKLPPIDNTANRVVFVGDSMTGQWFLGRSFPGRPYVNRAIDWADNGPNAIAIQERCGST